VGGGQTCALPVRSADQISSGLSVPGRRERAGICRVDSSGGLSVSSRLVISRTLPPPGEGAPKNSNFSFPESVCGCPRSLKRLGFVIVPAYPPAGGRCP